MEEAPQASTPPPLPQTQATAVDACTAWEAGTVPARPSLPLLLSRWLETGLKQEKKPCLLKSANILGKEGEPSLAWLLWERFRINYQRETSLPWTEQPGSSPHGPPTQGCTHLPRKPWNLPGTQRQACGLCFPGLLCPGTDSPSLQPPQGWHWLRRAPTPRPSPTLVPPTQASVSSLGSQLPARSS